ncbi:MAG: mechanosensitive ion channel family protein [Ignavibacteria bacterium]|nr:mechanosensitive ion channel family protein [Ignavibacteria bacterium]
MNFSKFFTPDKIIEVSTLVIIFVLSLIVINILVKKIRYILRDKVSYQTLSILNKFIVWGFIIAYVVGVLIYFGVKITGLLAVGGFLSIIIGLATQKVVGNVIAGLFLIIERPIKLGQSVRIDNISGFVEEIRFLSTIIRSFEGEFIRIPNEQVYTSVIINLMENVARRIDYLIDIKYSDNFDKAQEIISNLLDSEPFVLAVPQPEVFAEEFASSSVRVRIRFWSPTEKWYSTKNTLLQQIRNELERNGIQIPFPQMEVKIHNLKELH